MYLAFDVETTGLPRHRKCGYKNTEAWDTCRLVSLAIVQFNDKYEEVAHYSTLVKPEGFEVTATEIHGITHERAVAEGRPFNEVYEDVCMMFSEVPTVVGHNIEFDINTLCAEIHRRGLDMSPSRTSSRPAPSR